jgi:hypothetical protein
MYTLLELQSKTFGALKKIGYELNVLPNGDRRCRQSWIDAIAGVNPPLLQLLEVSPAAIEVQAQEPPLESKFGRIVYPRPAQEAIVLAAETSPGVEVDRAQEPIIEVAETSPGVEVDRAQEPIIEVAEDSPAASVEQVQEAIEVQAQEPIEYGRITGYLCRPKSTAKPIAQEVIAQVAETSPRVESVELTQKAQEHKFLLCLQDGDNTLWYDGKDFVCEKWSAKTYCKRGVGAAKHQLRSHPEAKRVFCSLGNVLQVVENSPRVEQIEVQAQEPPIESKFGRIVYPRPAQVLLDQAAKTSPGVEVDRVSEAIVAVAENPPGVEVDRVEDFLPECSNCFGDGYIEDEFGVVKFCQCNEPKLSHQKTQSAIVPAAKNLPGSRSKTSTAHQLLELFKSSAHIIEDAPGVKTEETVSESAIVPEAEKLPRSESDPNPILTGIPLSDRFVARYSPPQPENIHFKADTDGQLSLLDFDVELVNEPPDPDDFASIEEFQEALARWDAENAEIIAVSMDSMCEWAPCPDEWYEPEPESLPLKASSMMELSPPAIECSITSANFSIPTFDAWCDRANRQTDTDEPPDTGIFAWLPGPKPPKFPPRAIGYTQPNRPPSTASRNYPETIPKLFSVAAGTSTQPARSPPGGDA